MTREHYSDMHALALRLQAPQFTGGEATNGTIIYEFRLFLAPSAEQMKQFWETLMDVAEGKQFKFEMEPMAGVNHSYVSNVFEAKVTIYP